MAGRINEDDIQALRERADIAQIVGQYTNLKRAAGRLKGLCPFHQERTPSFTVDPAQGVYYCFGCSEGGDIYDFLQQTEALTFPEAVERAARTVGFELRYEEMTPGQREALGSRTRLVRVLKAATEFYSDRLRNPGSDQAAAKARRYLASRGISDDDAERFGLGWAPDGWRALIEHLLKRKFPLDDIVAAGLTTAWSDEDKQKGRKPNDYFRARIMFPIHDAAGTDVIGFGGRVLPGHKPETWKGDTEPPKYLNSRESDLYKKSRVLYGLHHSRGAIARSGTAFVVEGYTDVIALHIVGVDNVVASCGTALTADHFRVIEKFAPRVVLALDADTAGYKAADSARATAEQVGLREIGVLTLPPGRDPADLARSGKEAVEAALATTKTAVEFQIEHLLRNADLTTPESRVATLNDLYELLNSIPDRVLRFMYVRDEVAPAIGVPADRIEQELDRRRRTPTRRQDDQPEARTVTVHTNDPQAALERMLVQVAVQRPDLLPATWAHLEAADFTDPASHALFVALHDRPSGERLHALIERLPDDPTRAVARALQADDLLADATEATASELVERVRAASVGRRLANARERLAVATGDQRRELMREVLDLERRRRGLVAGL